ncbi:MAG TPA: mannose-6-phosphate isomerase, class I [Vicinamibacterales bacterium]|nr:mannose-6-phosphate isomerase, class I [Vicinamibacterales bacterium]
MSLLEITNEPRPYAWGKAGGIAAALGKTPTDRPEAELWLGAHPSSPSRVIGGKPWSDLGQWQSTNGTTLPFLLKILAAGAPLSLQAHPTDAQAQAGFERERSAGIPLDAPQRNYRDPYAKPELIVALEDGFRALCGFRPREESLAFAERLNHRSPTSAGSRWLTMLAEDTGIQRSVEWLMSGTDDAMDLTAEIVRQARAHDTEPDLDLARLLSHHHQHDPGVAVAQLLNDVVLVRGEALWLPAGNIHAYLSGTGIELMGPSDNVLRGGLTPKHVDVDELLGVLDFAPGGAPHLRSLPLNEAASTYLPRSMPSGASCPFQLLRVTENVALDLALSVFFTSSGEFELTSGERSLPLPRGRAAFLTAPSVVNCRGRGELFIATTDADLSEAEPRSST